MPMGKVGRTSCFQPASAERMCANSKKSLGGWSLPQQYVAKQLLNNFLLQGVRCECLNIIKYYIIYGIHV